ncbi:MAG: hypothetical protein Q8S54_12600 [Bacteroidota bacterium]|nr:hypothetical protein [Bacteroidota bacterium]
MKLKFNLILSFLLLSAILVHATSAEFTKNIKKGWTKSSVTALKITNKFGEVRINDTGGDSVTIKVMITIDNASESKAKELMNKIQVNFQKTGGLVSAETNIEENFRNNKSFSIDYLVNIPKDRELNITNKYGNLILNELDAKGFFDISYGSMTAGKIRTPANTPVKIILNYGKADLETINDADLEFKYSKLYANEINHLVLDAKYSTVNLHKVGKLTLDSKYDGINIDEIANLNSISKYTNYKIGLLTGSFDLDTGYGSVRISKVDAKFDNIRITNSYGGITVGLNELNYMLKADCDYCEVNYPENRYKGDRIRDNHRFSLNGSVGTGGGKVSITSRYGGIKLEE